MQGVGGKEEIAKNIRYFAVAPNITHMFSKYRKLPNIWPKLVEWVGTE